MENAHPVGITWGNPVITGHPEAKVSHMTDMCMKAHLMNECGAIECGCDQRTCLKYEKARFLNQCKFQKFDGFCDYV